MPSSQDIAINGRIYSVNPEVNRYQIPFAELDNMRVRDIPPHSHVEILGLEQPEEAVEGEVFGLNGGDEGDVEFLSVYGGIGFNVTASERSSISRRLHSAFPQPDEGGLLKNPCITIDTEEDGTLYAHAFLSLKFDERPDVALKQAVAPFADAFLRLTRPEVRLFVCHASEDKPTAREIAKALESLGTEVWFDEWEIRVGDSIVEKIDSALGQITHLVVLLSSQSVEKPWVRKELSSALMRQLSQEEIKILPCKLDDCTIPPILADVKYVDHQCGIRTTMEEIERAIFPLPKNNA